MLEIILLIVLTRRIGEIVEAKGRRGGWYKLLTVVLWIGCEIIGGIIGGIVAATTGSGNLFIYLSALLGAAVGAGLSFVVAKSVTPLAYDRPPPPQTYA